jgi:hypothetical protein
VPVAPGQEARRSPGTKPSWRAVDPLHAHAEPYGLDRAVLDAGRSIAQTCGSTLRAVYAYPGGDAFDLASAVEVTPGVFYGAEYVEAVHRRAGNELAEQFGIAATEVDLVEAPHPPPSSIPSRNAARSSSSSACRDGAARSRQPSVARRSA